MISAAYHPSPQPVPSSSDSFRQFLHALTALSPAPLYRLLESYPQVPPVAPLVAHNLAPFAFIRLRNWQALGHFPEKDVALLQQAYYASALREAVQHHQASAIVLAALNGAGVETVLMKGIALSHLVYPDPRCRLKVDLDLWIRAEYRNHAIDALQAKEYLSKNTEARSHAYNIRYGGEQQLVASGPGGGAGRVTVARDS